MFVDDEEAFNLRRSRVNKSSESKPSRVSSYGPTQAILLVVGLTVGGTEVSCGRARGR